MKMPNPESDAELVAAVRHAVRISIEPADVEEHVGRQAWINTTRQPDRGVIRMVDIGPDNEESDAKLPRLAEARDVVYWGRPLESPNPRLVGIAWGHDGSSEIFFGILYLQEDERHIGSPRSIMERWEQ